MKTAINLLISLLIGVVCVWLAFPSLDALVTAARGMRTLDPWWALACLGCLAISHLFRAWRWEYLLRPLGVRFGRWRMLVLSSVGFMAIIALPARLGEFVRPYLVKEKGRLRMSAALGTVAVERIVDGLLISLFVFAAFFRLGQRHPIAFFSAWVSLAVFAAATLFLALALRWPAATVRLAMTMSLLPRLWPRIAARIEHSLHGIVQGFRAIGDLRNLALFLAGSAVYWTMNGLSFYCLGRGFAGLDLSLLGSFAVMGVIAIAIVLPNSPGLIGQFHAAGRFGLAIYLPMATVDQIGMSYVSAMHAIQLVWYVGVGLLGLFSSHVSFARLVRASTAAAAEAVAEEAAVPPAATAPPEPLR